MINDIAIVGLSGRFPGANTIDEFWDNLRQGKEGIAPLTSQQLAQAGIPAEVYQKPNYVKVAPILKTDIAEFDADFFGYSPREAEICDPQQRLFLEVAWEALETAGLNPETTSQRIGIFGGVGRNTYLLHNLHHKLQQLDSVGAFQMLIGNDKDFLATRISYLFNLKGSSVTVQTACSTSLVAVHLAVSSLLNGENDVALAGGVSLKVPHLAGYHYQEGGIYSPDGHCRSFDAQGQGTVGGSGAGIVVLKRLEEAQADGNTIYAVIKGSAVNNDGAAKVGYTAPSVEGQASAIAEALYVADVDSSTIQYVEAHGTATPLGDPIEVQALNVAFANSVQKRHSCALGSVKSNVGHLDAAAGVTGLIKTVLSLYHQVIPPSLHFQQPNPEIDFEHSPFYVNTTLQPWQGGDTPRRAGVSSFGIGGTNAHLVLEEAPPLIPSSDARPYQLFLLSAKTETALNQATANLSQYLHQHRDVNLADVAYTLNTARKAFPYRRLMVSRDRASLIEKFLTTKINCCQEKALGVTFLFPGQGSQSINMAKELYEKEAVFRDEMNRAFEQMPELRSLLYPKEAEAASAREQLTQTQFTQPALFIVEYALARLWQSWGIQPQAMIGHSIGEYVAACLAGVFSFTEALNLIIKRGALMQTLPRGKMLSVKASAAEIQPFLGEDLAVAVINAPNLCVISGEESAIAQLQTQLNRKGLETRLLQTSHAFHSPMMEAIIADFTAQVAKLSLSPPQIPIISNLTGTWLTAEEATDPQYWGKQLRQTVQFSQGIKTLLQQECLFLEVGPGNTLSTLVKQQTTTANVTHSLPHPKAKTSDYEQLLTALGQLWLNGITPQWSKFYQQQRRQLLPLPTYPFQRQHYWIDPPTSSSAAPLAKKDNLSDWFYVPSWQRAILPLSASSDQDCLLFLDQAGFGHYLKQSLEAAGTSVITVEAGDSFRSKGDTAYVINPHSRADYETLIQTLTQRDPFPTQFLYCWTLNYQVAEAYFQQLLFLAQAIGKEDASQTLTLNVISSQQYEVIGTEVLSPDKAVVQGICKVMSQEYSQIACRLIDLDATEIERQPAALSQGLQPELSAPVTESVLAYRHGYRWRQTFEAVSVSAPTESFLREGGVYLITGGLGGIGLTLASAIAQTPKTKLILVSRSGLPDRQEWEDWLNGEEADEATATKIRQVQNLEAKGASVLVLAGDVSDRASMQSLITKAESQWGRINGVIHTAGVPGGGLMQLKSLEAACEVMAAKVTGTKILADLFGDHDLDFLLLNSSLSSQIGGIGQVDYCAANAFLDSFAHCANHRQRTLAVNWDTWQEVGMAVNTPVPEMLKQRREANLAMGISPAEGQAVFQRIQGLNVPQVIVCTKDLNTLLEKTATPESLETVREASSSSPVTTHPRPDLNVAYVAPRNETERIIADTWQQFLGLENIGVHDDFFALGGHSLLATEIITALRDQFQQELPLNRLFETPTVAELATLITTEESDSQEIQPRDETEELLSELSELSTSEVDSLLKQVLNRENDDI